MSPTAIISLLAAGIAAGIFYLKIRWGKTPKLNCWFKWRYENYIEKLTTNTTDPRVVKLLEDLIKNESPFSSTNSAHPDCEKLLENSTKNDSQASSTSRLAWFWNADPRKQEQFIDELNKITDAKINRWIFDYIDPKITVIITVVNIVIVIIVLILLLFISAPAITTTTVIPVIASTESLAKTSIILDSLSIEKKISLTAGSENVDIDTIEPFRDFTQHSLITTGENTPQSLPPNSPTSKTSTTKLARNLVCPSVFFNVFHQHDKICRVIPHLGKKADGYRVQEVSCGPNQPNFFILDVYSLDMFEHFNLRFVNGFRRITAITFHGESLCSYEKKSEPPSSALNLLLSKVTHLGFKNAREDCRATLKAVESWKMPVFESITVENSHIDKSFSLYMKELFSKYADSMKMLSFQNISICSSCNIFEGDFKLYTMVNVTLNYFTPNTSFALRQTEQLINIAPYLIDFETNTKFPKIQDTIKSFKQRLPCLKRYQVTLGGEQAKSS